jgi:cysteine desulfurase
VPGTIINGVSAPRIPTISNLSFSLTDQLIKHLDGLVATSAGAACSCAKPQPSKVLTNMNLPEDLAKNCLRLSANRQTHPMEIKQATKIIIQAAKKLLP